MSDIDVEAMAEIQAELQAEMQEDLDRRILLMNRGPGGSVLIGSGGVDFSAYNPLTSNSLNLAARKNQVDMVAKLLKEKNVNNSDNRGWTCLHEAAAHDSYESLVLILNDMETRHLVETHEGHTALYLAVKHKCSIRSIKAILDRDPEIVYYSSNEMVSPFHLACSQGRLDLVIMLMEYGTNIDAQDFDGDTPLHDAADNGNTEVVSVLLHAGAQPELQSLAKYVPFHTACVQGSLATIKALRPFVTNMDYTTLYGKTGLMLAAQVGADDICAYLLENNANANIRCHQGDLALNLAMNDGFSQTFRVLLPATDPKLISKDIFMEACKPHLFKMEIIVALLESDLGPEFFNYADEVSETTGMLCRYKICAPLCSFLYVADYVYAACKEKFVEYLYKMLMKGPSVNALYPQECPPLVYIHFCRYRTVFPELIQVFLEQGCDVDYFSNYRFHFSDAFLTSISTGGLTLPYLIPYSISCEPVELIKFCKKIKIIDRIPHYIHSYLLSLVDLYSELRELEDVLNAVLPLKHLARVAVRANIRRNKIKNVSHFYETLKEFPVLLRDFLRYD